MPGATPMVQVSCRSAFAVGNPAGSRCKRHAHPYAEVVLMLSGDGVLHQDGGRHPYHSGSALITPANSEHWIEQHRAGCHLCLSIVGGDIDRLGSGVRPIPAPLEGVIGLIVRELSATPEQGRLDCFAGLVASFLASPDAESAPAVKPGNAANDLAQADALLRAHLDRPLGAGELADALFISPGYLRQLFHRAYGHGPMHRLLELRIEHAKKLLADGSLPVGEVARRCGFVSPFHFSRMFSRLAGVPPSQWRRDAIGA